VILGLRYHELGIIKALPPGKLLCLGYPDIIATAEELEALGLKQLEPVANQRIAALHKWPGTIWEAEPLLREMGFEPIYLDIAHQRGKEELVDLNMPLPAYLERQFDAVIDGGTIEHCMNIGGAWVNIARAMKSHAWVLHLNPANQVNHGFYSISPTLYASWYREIILHRITWLEKGEYIYKRLGNPNARGILPVNACNVVVARYPRSDWPVQWKYSNKELPTTSGPVLMEPRPA